MKDKPTNVLPARKNAFQTRKLTPPPACSSIAILSFSCKGIRYQQLLFTLNNCTKPIESANTGEPQSLNPCYTNCRPGVKGKPASVQQHSRYILLFLAAW
uniref:Uncharacterized protein n=1 Tax=Glossina palpalis gambiensis TaxID=67801 RepID=A0A1B0BE92_9MUSC